MWLASRVTGSVVVSPQHSRSGVSPLAVREVRKTVDMGDTLGPQPVWDFVFRHKPYLWGEDYYTIGFVPRWMERDCYGFFAKVGAGKEFFVCLSTCLSPHGERAVCRSFDFKVFTAADAS